ncbi:MAG: two-component sensor histidine kinase, partial [Frankiales bacterium]|nr:two-component sensor histidine kinase [Frankiales bacterium]
VSYGATGVTVQVTDDGRGGGSVPAGNGLTGMRERAVALGGSLAAGPRPEGGFRVEAVLPL